MTASQIRPSLLKNVRLYCYSDRSAIKYKFTFPTGSLVLLLQVIAVEKCIAVFTRRVLDHTLQDAV